MFIKLSTIISKLIIMKIVFVCNFEDFMLAELTFVNQILCYTYKKSLINVILVRYFINTGLRL